MQGSVTMQPCPYPKCRNLSVVRWGFSLPLESLGLRRQRWKCSRCKRTYSDNFHSMNYRYRNKDQALNAKIFRLCIEGLSNRSIARMYQLSESAVRARLVRLSQRALVFHDELLRKYVIGEVLCFDGLENFAGSQYDVNNIQQALGRDSLFIYDFNIATMNRKGRMSPWQKNRLSEIEMDQGRYPPRSIRWASADLILRLHQKSKKPLQLISDEHFQYKRAIHWDLGKLNIEHATISSKVCRNFQNILFSVNHADLMVRKRLAAFARETISFSKTHGAMCQKFALFLIFKNYMSAQFTKKHVRRPRAHRESPAQSAGISEKLLSFSDIFSRRSVTSDGLRLNSEWRCFFEGTIPSRYQRNRSYRRRDSRIA